MTKDQATKVAHGLYVIHWKENAGGGTSLASVGSDREGRRWFAATNWISGVSFDWRNVEKVVRVRVASEERKKWA